MTAHASYPYPRKAQTQSRGRVRGGAFTMQYTSIDTSTDATAPTLTPISPTPGDIIYPTSPLVVQVEDNIGFSLREIWARFGTTNRWELVYGDDAFVAPYAGSSVVAELGTPGPGFYDRRTYTVRRTGGWPSNASVVRLRFTVVDSAGNTLVLA